MNQDIWQCALVKMFIINGYFHIGVQCETVNQYDILLIAFSLSFISSSLSPFLYISFSSASCFAYCLVFHFSTFIYAFPDDSNSFRGRFVVYWACALHCSFIECFVSEKGDMNWRKFKFWVLWMLTSSCGFSFICEIL